MTRWWVSWILCGRHSCSQWFEKNWSFFRDTLKIIPSGNVHCEEADYPFICLRAWQLRFRLLKGWKMRFPKDAVWQTVAMLRLGHWMSARSTCPALIAEYLNFYPSSLLVHKNWTLRWKVCILPHSSGTGEKSFHLIRLLFSILKLQ